jgi:hypothetical protein
MPCSFRYRDRHLGVLLGHKRVAKKHVDNSGASLAIGQQRRPRLFLRRSQGLTARLKSLIGIG